VAKNAKFTKCEGLGNHVGIFLSKSIIFTQNTAILISRHNAFPKNIQFFRPQIKPKSLEFKSCHPIQVQASHLLVKHRDSRRPSSWREENITRSKEEALEILLGKLSHPGSCLQLTGRVRRR
jgi:hypothetical protein